MDERGNNTRHRPKYDQVAVCGRIDCGKNTLAGLMMEAIELAGVYTFETDSFAKQLKDDVAEKKKWDRALLEGDTREGKIWRETYIDPETGLTPRQVLQEYGTQCRRIFGADIWVNIVERRALERATRGITTVETDCRFFNEQKMILKNNGIVFIIQRHKEDFIVRYNDKGEMEHESERSFWQILDMPQYKERVILLDNTEEGGLEKLVAQIIKCFAASL